MARRKSTAERAGAVSSADNLLWVIRCAKNPSQILQLIGDPESLFGNPPSHLVEVEVMNQFSSWIHPDDLAIWTDFSRTVQSHGQGHCSYRIRTPDNRFGHCLESARSLNHNNGKPLIVSCLVPVRSAAAGKRLLPSLQKRLEAFMAGWQGGVLQCLETGNSTTPSASEIRLSYALRNADDGLWDWDLRTDEVYYSPGWKALFGYADHELPNQLSTWKQLVDPADRERALDDSARCVAGLTRRMETEFRMRHRDGHWVNILSRGVVVRDGEGKPLRLVGTHLDITGQKKAEQELLEVNEALRQSESRAVQDFQAAVTALRESEARLRLALEASGAVVWSWNCTTNQVWWGEGYNAMFGFSPGTVPSFERWQSSLHPEDWPRLEARIGALLGASADSVWDEEFRIILPTGGVRWIYGLGHVERDQSGRAVRLHGINLDITQRKEFESLLHENEERLRLAMMAANQGFYDLNVQTGECVVSPEYARMLGYEPEGFVETNAAWIGRLHPDDQEPAAHAYRDYIAGKMPVYAVEFRQRTKSGGWKWILSLGKIVAHSADGQPLRMLGTHTDITKRKGMELELESLNETLERKVADRTLSLRKSEQRFRSLSDAALEGLMVTQHGIIIDCNERLAAMLGRTRESLLGTQVFQYADPDSRALIKEAVLAGKDLHTELRWIRADGSLIHVEVNGTSPDGPDGIRLTAARDITQRKVMEQLEAELADQRASLSRFQRSAELAEVSAGVIHQIGQPLTAVLNNISAAKTMASRCSNPNCAALEAMLDSDQCLRQVQVTMSRLRSLAHPERVQREEVKVSRLVLEVVKLVRIEAEKFQVALLTSIPGALPTILGDPVQLTQALVNVARNAVEAAALTESAPRLVSVTVTSAGPELIGITVTDTGPGIDGVHQDRLFEPFFTTKADGMGVGLSLSRTIVQAHGGGLEAFNNPNGRGASFRITLPVAKKGENS